MPSTLFLVLAVLEYILLETLFFSTKVLRLFMSSLDTSRSTYVFYSLSVLVILRPSLLLRVLALNCLTRYMLFLLLHCRRSFNLDLLGPLRRTRTSFYTFQTLFIQ